MAFLGPGIGKEYINQIQTICRDLILQHFDDIVIADANIGQIFCRNLSEQAANSRAVHFYCQIIIFRIFTSQSSCCITHAGTDIKYSRRGPLKDFIQIKFYMIKFNAILVPVILNGLALAFGHAAFATHKTANMAEWIDQSKIRKSGCASDRLKKSSINRRRCTGICPAWHASGKVGFAASFNGFFHSGCHEYRVFCFGDGCIH